MAVRVQDGLWRRSSNEGASSNDRRSSSEGANDRTPELDAVDTLFEEALGGTNGGCAESEEKESPDIDAFEYMPQGLRLSYSLRTARTRADSLSSSSHSHSRGL